MEVHLEILTFLNLYFSENTKARNLVSSINYVPDLEFLKNGYTSSVDLLALYVSRPVLTKEECTN